MHKQLPPLSPHDGSQGNDIEQRGKQDYVPGAEQDPGEFSFALHALSEMNGAGADALHSGDGMLQAKVDSSKESEEERIRNLQAALDSYKDWLSSI